MCINLMHINPLYFKRGFRLLGEVDLFLLSELPLKKLLELQKCSQDEFSKTLADILLEIGENLADRLLKSPDYELPFWEVIENSGCVSFEQARRMWVNVVFMSPILEKWDKIPARRWVTPQLTKHLSNGLVDSKDNIMVYLYAILVYARTLVKQKGGSTQKWQELRPNKIDL